MSAFLLSPDLRGYSIGRDDDGMRDLT